MLGSFALGFFGALMKVAGFLLFLLSAFGLAAGGPNAGLWMGVSIFMFVCGAFCGYVSRQTVRVRG
jgi:uncharacterized membrane protein